MHLQRTRFKKEIVSEFIPPTGTKARGVIIWASGMPGYPGKKEKADSALFLAEKGYWVFIPRYRGSWESGGEFLKDAPTKDILDVVDSLDKGFSDLWSGKKHQIKNLPIYIIGSSFGGPAALFASLDKRVNKVVVLSGIADWLVDSKDESMGKLGIFTKDAFGEGYRFSLKNWQKLSDGKFYNPMPKAKEFDGRKILVIHAKDDQVAPFAPTKKFVEITKCEKLFLPKGGHLGSLAIIKPRVWRQIGEFLAKNDQK